MLLILGRDYWLIICRATAFCSTNLLKASALAKITCIRTEDIDHWAVIQSDRVINMELSYDGAAGEWRSRSPIFYVCKI